MKKAQVSIFIVLAILLVFLFAFVFLLRDVTRNKEKPKPNELTDLDTQKVKEFVNRCLLDTTIRGLLLLGKQGGVIFSSQQGLTSDKYKNTSYVFDYNGQYIMKGILAGEWQPGDSCVPWHPRTVYNPERCPSYAFPFVSTVSDKLTMEQKESRPPPGYPFYIRLFNAYNLPRLYPNTPEFRSLSPTKNFIERSKSIHSNLKSYIEKNIASCLDFGAFNESGLKVIPNGSLVVEPIIAEDYVYARMNYPLIIKKDNKQMKKLIEFFINTKIRLKPMYRLLDFLLNNEAKNFSFDILNPGWGVTGVNYTLYRDVKSKADLLVVEDTKSVVINSSGMIHYKFYTVIENSQPAISYIHYENLDTVPGLRQKIVDCPLINPRDNPWEDSPRLSVGIGKKMSRKAIECIWYAYTSLYGLRYRKAFDPDDDILHWDFKTARCNWNEECQYKGTNLYFDNYLLIRFSDGQYYDYLNISLQLVDHPPTIQVTFIGELNVSNKLWLVYIVNATDPDIIYKDEVDKLSLSISGYPSSPIIYTNSSNYNLQVWGVKFEKLDRRYPVTFTISDTHGLSASQTINVG